MKILWICAAFLTFYFWSYVAILGSMKPIIDKKYLDSNEEKSILKLSRFVLQKHILEGKDHFSDSDLVDFKITKNMKQELGVFVTLHIASALRGCIGHIVGDNPLYKGVIDNTINSSTHDPRFNRVSESEVDNIDIEISVMTPLELVEDYNDIRIGRDGLLLNSGYSSGVFLPQVPLEQGWDLEEYLHHLCFKAGVDSSVLKAPSTNLYRFSAQVFGENDYK